MNSGNSNNSGHSAKVAMLFIKKQYESTLQSI